MSLISNIRTREYGLEKEIYRFSLSNVIDKVTCIRNDEHHIEAQEFGECTPPLACRFSRRDPHILAVADEDGGILILNTNLQGIHATQQDWLAHKNAVFDADWMPQENKILTASGDQTVVLWDVEAEEKLSVFKGHSSSVKTARFAVDNKYLFATGARDGNIMLFDHRVKEKDGQIPAVNVIRNAHKCVTVGSAHKKRKGNQQESPQSVTAVIFQDDNTVISTGSVDGSIKVWDIRKTYSMLKTDPIPKDVFQYAGSGSRTHGFSCLTLDSTRSRLFASCMDNVIYQYDAAGFSKKPVATYQGHKNTTFYIKTVLSPDEQLLLSGSSDNMGYVWKIAEPSAQPWMLQGHSGEVSAVEWCRSDIGKIVTVSDDSTIRVWRLDTQQEAAPQIGQNVGSIQRTQEKGVTANMNAAEGLSNLPVKKIAKTPQKGRMVPPSPCKISPTMKKNILQLSASKVKVTQESSSHKTSSPSIVSWFSKGQGQKPKSSPLKKTPRKLIITPRKEEQCSDSDALSSSQPPSSSVKRKLYNLESPPSGQENKRQKTVEHFFCGHVPDENSCDGFFAKQTSPSPDKSRILVQNVNKNSVKNINDNSNDIIAVNAILCDKDIVTPVKTNPPYVYESPTINLPNYVFDPVPRTPVAPSGDRTPKTPNWLTQMRLQRTMSASKANNDLLTTPKGSLSIPADMRTSKTTPRRKKVPLKRRGSIAQYFSPNAPGKKPDKDS